MSNVIATMANALIEFILSLLGDPEVAAEFEEDPQGTLNSRGLENVNYNDLCSVLPMVYDNPHVILRNDPGPFLPNAPAGGTGGADAGGSGPGQVIQQLQDLVTNNAYVTNNSTILDQSVNQNLWAEGDILQVFDNEAIVASGAGASAAGRDIVDDDSTDSSTNVTVGGDAVIDSTLDVDTAIGSDNDVVNAPVTDDSVTTTVTDGTATTTVTETTTGASDAPTDASDPAPAAEPEPAAAAEPAAEPAAAPEPEPEPAPAPEPDAALSYESDPYDTADESTALSEPEPLAETTADSEY